MKIDFYKFFGVLNYLSYILWLLELNAAVLLVNLPMVIAIWAVHLELWTLPLFFLAGITIGPSVLAAFEAMPHIEDGVLKYYFGSLKNSWKSCLKIWIPAWFVLLFLTADLMILDAYQVMVPLKWGMLVSMLLLTTYLLVFLMVWATWKQNAKDAGRLALKLTFVKPLRCNLSLPILLGVMVLLNLKPIYLLLYGTSLGLFLIYKNFQPVIKFVEERPENKKENSLERLAECGEQG